jgi:carbonic anhydrase/acetyltransferase-like protein (isoleucine patch superfamily)
MDVRDQAQLGSVRVPAHPGPSTGLGIIHRCAAALPVVVVTPCGHGADRVHRCHIAGVLGQPHGCDRPASKQVVVCFRQDKQEGVGRLPTKTGAGNGSTIEATIQSHLLSDQDRRRVAAFTDDFDDSELPLPVADAVHFLCHYVAEGKAVTVLGLAAPQSEPRRDVFDFEDGAGAVPAHRHINQHGSEGGWVANTAFAARTVFIGRDARVAGTAIVADTAKVFDNARVGGNARVLDGAWVSENATVDGDAQVCGHATVYGNARVGGTAFVGGYSKVGGSTVVRQDAVIGDKVILHGLNARPEPDGIKGCWTGDRPAISTCPPDA